MVLGPSLKIAAVAAAVFSVGAAALAPGVAATATAPTARDSVTLAYYSSGYSAPQSKSPASMRSYLSTMQPSFDLQSYVFYGSLVEPNGRTGSFSLLMQQSNHIVAEVPSLSFALEGVMFNGGKGFTVAGLEGLPEYTIPLSLTARPWSARAQSFALGEQPQFVDARVVKGAMGERGAVYEFTAEVPGQDIRTQQTFPFEVYVRVRDMTGIVQWGYGPSGFFPQWIYPAQRAAIMTRDGGSVERYLTRTDDPMRGQGDYYYSSPLMQVEKFVIRRNHKVVSAGTDGDIWFDTVTQSYGPKGNAIVENGVQWLEFALQLPETGQALKIGHVIQDSVGTMPYAILVASGGDKARNGTIVPSARWDIGDIHITPVKSSIWTSPQTGERYYMKYRVRLDGESAATSADLVVTAQFDDQELVLSKARTVYEGLFDFDGMLNGAEVSGSGWGEIQPANSL